MDIDLDYYNPYPSFQPGQKEAICQMVEAFESGQKVVELNAPTASGKSLDLYILGRVLSEEFDMDKTIYSTPLVSLVDQLGSNELFASKLPVLKGKRNYPCSLMTWINADDCPFDNFGHALNHCKRVLENENSEPCASCVYQRDRMRFKAAKFGATTFARYLVDPACHGDCRALLIDESAGLERTLVDRSTLKLPDNIDRVNLRASVVAYNQELLTRIIQLGRKIESARKSEKPDLKYIAELTKALNKNNRESAKCNKVINHIDKNHNYILDSEMRFRLLEGKTEFDDLIENLGFVVLASGTPTSDLYCDRFKKIDVQHPIPVSQRMVYYNPVGSMNYKERQQTAPAMSGMIEKLHAKYHKKTMVHCGAYNVANMLYSNLSREGKDIAILQDQKDREGSKNKFLSATEAIFLSVEFVEGLDLKGSEYPLNIVAKVPFENTSDEFIKARNDHDNWKRYNLFAAVEVMQAAGRCTRTPTDFSETYILDESWKRFYGRMSKRFQPWFKAAIKNINLE
jgi:Rad3-related DNA helicase